MYKDSGRGWGNQELFQINKEKIISKKKKKRRKKNLRKKGRSNFFIPMSQHDARKRNSVTNFTSIHEFQTQMNIMTRHTQADELAGLANPPKNVFAVVSNTS